MVEIEFLKLKDMNLEGATIVEGFPGVGVVAAISASYLIDHLKLDQICALDSDDFPPTSMIYAKKPKFPARIYASEQYKVGVFISEFTPQPPLHRPIARRLMEWCREHRVKRIIAIEGLPIKSEEGVRNEEAAKGLKVYGIGSNDRARADLERAGIEQLEKGMIYGVTGVLLNVGRWEDFNVITLLVDAYESIPDAFAAARLLEALDILLPEFRIDTKPLYDRAKDFESQLRQMRGQVKPPIPEPYKDMYQ